MVDGNGRKRDRKLPGVAARPFGIYIGRQPRGRVCTADVRAVADTGVSQIPQR